MNRSIRSLLNCLLICACWLSPSALAVAASTDWSGVWQTNWREGSGRLILEQKGDVVTGRDQMHHGRIEAKAEGTHLKGRWISDGNGGAAIADDFVFVLGRGGKDFTGRADGRGWWNGVRTQEPGIAQAIGLGSPREAFMRFLVAANAARNGRSDSWTVAARAIDFEAGDAPESTDVQLRRLRDYFDVIDLTTFRAWDTPVDAPSGSVTLRLTQPRSDAVLALTLRRNDAGEWHIVVPSEESVAASRKALLAVFGATPPSAQSFTQLRSPRDAMRSFMVGMADWDGLGHDLAISTLDLSSFPESLRADDSELVAGYLGRALHHIGFLGLQSISNDGSVRDPYVHFVHDVGSIVIAPSGPGADAPWQFTSATVQHIPEVYMAVSELPPDIDAPPRLAPPMTYFKLREFVKDNVPALMSRVRRLEAWQVVSFVLILPPLLFTMRALSGLLVRQLRRIPNAPERQPRLLPWALTVVVTATVVSPLPGILGIPAYSRQFSVPVVAALVFSGGAYLAWYIVSLVGGVLQARAARTVRSGDDLAVSLLLACARIAIVFAAIINIAYYFSMPTSSVLAGVGLGGLAVAFASRETLTNLFGAGVIMADRPFRRGDWIDCNFASGFIEDVGIRSTRVRTADDSLVVVPNGKLAGAIINNLGKRRVRHLAVDLTLAAGATPAAIETFIGNVRSHVVRNNLLVTSRTEVGVTELGGSGTAQIELRGYLNVATDGAESKVRHALLIELQNIAAASGVKLDKSRIVSVKPPGVDGGDDGDEGGDDLAGGA